MTVLVTGGAGTIGSNIARLLLTQGKSVVIFDRVAPPPDGKMLAGFGDKLKVEVGHIADTATV